MEYNKIENDEDFCLIVDLQLTSDVNFNEIVLF